MSILELLFGMISGLCEIANIAQWMGDADKDRRGCYLFLFFLVACFLIGIALWYAFQ